MFGAINSFFEMIKTLFSAGQTGAEAINELAKVAKIKAETYASEEAQRLQIQGVEFEQKMLALTASKRKT